MSRKNRNPNKITPSAKIRRNLAINPRRQRLQHNSILYLYLFFAPLAVPVFLYIGDIFPYYTPFVPIVFAVVSYLNSAHTRFVHLTDRNINYVNKGKITKSIKLDEISLIKLTATPLFGHIVPTEIPQTLCFRSS